MQDNLFAKKLQSDPEYKALFNEACALIDMHEYNEAISLFRQLTERWPEQPHAYALLGAMMEEQGKLEEANRCFRKAAALLEDSSLATQCVFHSYWRMKKFEYALDELRRFAKTGGKCNAYVEIISELKERCIMDDHFNLLREPADEEFRKLHKTSAEIIDSRRQALRQKDNKPRQEKDS
jgi:tetratricopeptide (TPR) repeat protein